MTRLEVLAWLASKGFKGNTVKWLQKHELVALAEGVRDYLAGPQDQEAKLRLQEILNEANSSKESQPLEQRQISDEDSTIPSAKISIVTGTNTEPQDLSLLQ